MRYTQYKWWQLGALLVVILKNSQAHTLFFPPFFSPPCRILVLHWWSMAAYLGWWRSLMMSSPKSYKRLTLTPQNMLTSGLVVGLAFTLLYSHCSAGSQKYCKLPFFIFKNELKQENNIFTSIYSYYEQYWDKDLLRCVADANRKCVLPLRPVPACWNKWI